MYNEKIKNILFSCFLFTCVQALGYTDGPTRDMATTRANTLTDDADDIQKQLDNEARDKMKYGRPKAMWVFHFPTQITGVTTENIHPQPRESKLLKRRKASKKTCQCKDPTTCLECVPETLKDWSYKDQGNWSSTFPECGSHSQSPVDLPCSGMVTTKGMRKMLFINYDVQPKSMTMVHNGNMVFVIGEWAPSKRPIIYGGAAYGRRYVFHSLALRWPSDHSVGGLYYPLESQAIHVSVEYGTLNDAVQASPKDKLALLAVSNIYKYSARSHKGLEELVQTILSTSYGSRSMKPVPLAEFSPPLTEYAAYHGSLTTPPCTESVLWLIRAKSMHISRRLAEALDNYSAKGEVGQTFHRLIQPLNDRKVYFFN